MTDVEFRDACVIAALGALIPVDDGPTLDAATRQRIVEEAVNYGVMAMHARQKLDGQCR